MSDTLKQIADNLGAGLVNGSYLNGIADYYGVDTTTSTDIMADILTAEEKTQLLFAGKFILYMQALRFLSDYLQGSIYYPISYPEQNLLRSLNQFQLLQSIVEKEKNLEQIIHECLT